MESVRATLMALALVLALVLPWPSPAAAVHDNSTPTVGNVYPVYAGCEILSDVYLAIEAMVERRYPNFIASSINSCYDTRLTPLPPRSGKLIEVVDEFSLGRWNQFVTIYRFAILGGGHDLYVWGFTNEVDQRFS